MYTLPSKNRLAFFRAASKGLVLCLLAAGMLASCAKVAIKQSWREPGADAPVYKKLLVIGISPDATKRSLLENILTYTLRDHGVAAVASHTLIEDLRKADRDLLQGTAQKAGADAVLITRGLSKAEHTNYQYSTGTFQRMTVVEQRSTPDASATIVMSTATAAPTETDFETVSLQTRLFDTASAKLVWSALSNASLSGQRYDACWDFSFLLVKALSKERLIEINDKEFRQPSF